MRVLFAVLAAVAALAAQAAPSPAKSATPDLTGTWECSVNYQGQPIPVVLHLSKDKTGALAASMANVMEPGGADVDASVTFQDGALHVDVPSLPTSFDGKINATGDAIDGSWSYQGDAVACTLSKDKPGN